MKATINIPDLEVYVTVVRLGSFTKAAEALSSGKAQTSRVVSRLEEGLGVKLLQRSTRRLSMTEAGRELFERAVRILEAIEETELAMASTQSEPQGTLRVAAGFDFGTMRVDQWLADYLKTYPKVRVQADYSNRITDIIHEGVDVAIRIGELPDSELSARKLGMLEYALYAAPSYFKGKGRPRHPKELSDYDIVMFGPRGRSVWKLQSAHESATISIKESTTVSSIIAAQHLVEAGIGIGLLPMFRAEPSRDRGKLLRVLPKWSRVPIPVHAVFASSQYLSPKVRAFVDIASDSFAS